MVELLILLFLFGKGLIIQIWDLTVDILIIRIQHLSTISPHYLDVILRHSLFNSRLPQRRFLHLIACILIHTTLALIQLARFTQTAHALVCVLTGIGSHLWALLFVHVRRFEFLKLFLAHIGFWFSIYNY